MHTRICFSPPPNFCWTRFPHQPMQQSQLLHGLTHMGSQGMHPSMRPNQMMDPQQQQAQQQVAQAQQQAQAQAQAAQQQQQQQQQAQQQQAQQQQFIRQAALRVNAVTQSLASQGPLEFVSVLFLNGSLALR